jgi:hypothetical protein
MDDYEPPQWVKDNQMRIEILKIEAFANGSLYYFPDNDPDSWGYCVQCERNSISCECYDSYDED